MAPWPVNGANPTSPETYARCSDGVSQVVADGTGAWEVTSTPTEGATNQCNGLFTATPWPDTHNGQAVTTADNVDLGQNVSGLYYVGGNPTTTADDYIWAIQNGSSGLPGANKGDPGSLYKLVQDASGKWGPAPGWESGVPVRYLNDTTGEPDSEGVTAVNGKVYVASERDNTNDTVSKISVLEVDPSNIVAQNGDTDGDLNATHEWDLGPDLGPNPGNNPETGLDPANPGDANLGIEAVAFVPDSYLTSVGFKDEHTGAAYNPANYPNHIDGGVFFVGLEKTGKLYGYVFNSDNTFTRIATINTGFQTIQDLLWDPSQDALWATCDNGCQGRSSILQVDTNADAHQGTFQVKTVYSRPTGATQNLNNEGFTVQPISECVNGSRSAFWSDDSDDGGHWLRTASVDCTADTTPPTITASRRAGGERERLEQHQRDRLVQLHRLGLGRRPGRQLARQPGADRFGHGHGHLHRQRRQHGHDELHRPDRRRRPDRHVHRQQSAPTGSWTRWRSTAPRPTPSPGSLRPPARGRAGRPGPSGPARIPSARRPPTRPATPARLPRRSR